MTWDGNSPGKIRVWPFATVTKVQSSGGLRRCSMSIISSWLIWLGISIFSSHPHSATVSYFHTCTTGSCFRSSYSQIDLRLFTANIFSVIGWACPLHQLGVLHVIQNIIPNLPQGNTRLATSRAPVLLLPAAAKALRGEQITGSSLPEPFSKCFKNTWQTVSTLLSWSRCFPPSHCLQVFDGAPSEGPVNHFTPLRWLIIMLTQLS